MEEVINQQAQESEISTVKWVWNLYGIGKFLEVADPKLCGVLNDAHPHSRSRPSIRQGLQTLNFEASGPILPSEMPMATYFDSFDE